MLKLKPGDTLRVGIVNGLPATATVAASDADGGLDLRWRPGVEDLDEDTARRRLSDTTRIDLLLAMPRPKVMTRLWAPIASTGVQTVYLTNAARVERYYFDSKALDREKVETEMLRGMEQSGDVVMPGVCVVKRFPAAMDAIRGAPSSATWMIDSPGRVEEQGEGVEEPHPVMLVAHPGARTTLAQALNRVKTGEEEEGEGGGERGGAVPGEARGGTVEGTLSASGNRRVLIAVGPEGGWTEYERGVMLQSGFTEFALGNRTFATDVACIALVAAVRERTESW